MPERYFTPEDLPQCIVNDVGTYAIADRQPSVDLRHAGETADGTPLWWQEVHEEPVMAAMELRKNSIVRGIGILATHGASEERLSLTFAGYLTELRAKNRGTAIPCVVSMMALEIPPDYVRLPHLVAYSADNITVTDRAIWEVLPSTEAIRWLGGALPDQRFIEKNLSQLLELRAAYRANQLPDTRHYRELARLLSEGRYLSLLFIYQHSSIFEALLQE